MNTQIIKLEAWKTNIKESLKKLGYRNFKKNSEVTVIIKENPNMLNVEDLKEKSERERSISISDVESSQIRRITTQNDEDQEEDSDESLQIRISNTDILPNVLISSHKRNNRDKDRRPSLDLNVLSGLNPDREKKHKEEPKEKMNNLDPKNNQQEASEDPEHSYTIAVKEAQQAEKNPDAYNPFSMFGSPTSKVSKLEQVEGKQVEDDDSINQISLTEDEEEEQSAPDSLFVVENKLNDALVFIQKNRLFQLEEFLYDFKTKYSNINERVQIKWRLLMGYCKENRKQYERASILYSQVLELAEQSPKSLIIDRADINHRLGICYMQIRRWNDGIIAFVEALNEFKLKKKLIKYAECINNLGTLYLYADQIDQAEKCFLVSYEIKKKNYPQYSRKLISSLLNLYECNIANLNYEQAQQMLKLVETIVTNLPDNDMLKGGLLRRKGKLSFLIGDVETAEQYYLKGINLLSGKFPFCLDFGELMNNYAMLKLDEGKLQQAKKYFDKALIILNFYFTKDSSYVQAIKKNLDLTNRMLIQLISEQKQLTQ